MRRNADVHGDMDIKERRADEARSSKRTQLGKVAMELEALLLLYSVGVRVWRLQRLQARARRAGVADMGKGRAIHHGACCVSSRPDSGKTRLWMRGHGAKCRIAV
jgi:hypothetical protein